MAALGAWRHGGGVRLAFWGGWLLLVLLAVPAFAQDRLRGVALVIGQSDYRTLAPLPNPQNDAEAIDGLLSDLGFDVTLVRDGDRRRLGRAIEHFVEDAADADVALLYYSGHGIEAGGENFLVPVETDMAALDDAAASLVAVSPLLDELRRVVPVTILLLDACRDNPFPPDAQLVVERGKPPVPLAAGGLSAPRGVTRLAPRAEAGTTESLGAVIGFAAAPGEVALDGEPGGNSPYAAALVKHLAAGGYPFGDIMTMVTEEVWLRTAAAQTPWTNSSLRRRLAFGGRAGEPAGEEELIRGERRKLLLTISAMGQAERRQVAGHAQEGGVPMDALFAMLSAVGAEVPQDPDDLDRMLRDQAARLKAMFDERAALRAADPEIARLAALAETAVREGALAAAITLNERAKARIAELSRTVASAEAEIAARRTEFAAVYEKSAQTYALAADHAAAARDYGAAFAEVERWNRDLAWRYKFGEAEALMAQGHYRSDFAAQDAAIAAYRGAAGFAPRGERRTEWARTQSALAFAQWVRADRTGADADALAALETMRAAVAVVERDTDPDIWAEMQGRLGSILLSLGWRSTGTGLLEEGAAAIRNALTVQTRQSSPAEWSRQQNRLGAGLLMMATREPGTEHLREAITALEESLSERLRARVPLDWAQTETNRASALMILGMRTGDRTTIAQAEQAIAGTLEIYDREKNPLLWAEAKANHGAALWQLALHESGTDRAAQSAAAFRDALAVIPRNVAPLRWAGLQDNLALALKTIGERRNDEIMVEESIAHYRLALEERRRDRVPLEWASTTNNLANTLMALGYAQGRKDMLEDAVGLFRQVLEVNRREAIPLEWARANNNVGLALQSLAHAEFKIGTAEAGRVRLAEAITHFRLSLEENTRERVPTDYGMTQVNLARALLDLGRASGDRALLAEAKAALQAAREAWLAAGYAQYAANFNNLEMEIGIADLQVQVQEQARKGSAGRTAP